MRKMQDEIRDHYDVSSLEYTVRVFQVTDDVPVDRHQTRPGETESAYCSRAERSRDVRKTFCFPLELCVPYQLASHEVL